MIPVWVFEMCLKLHVNLFGIIVFGFFFFTNSRKLFQLKATWEMKTLGCFVVKISFEKLLSGTVFLGKCRLGKCL